MAGLSVAVLDEKQPERDWHRWLQALLDAVATRPMFKAKLEYTGGRLQTIHRRHHTPAPFTPRISSRPCRRTPTPARACAPLLRLAPRAREGLAPPTTSVEVWVATQVEQMSPRERDFERLAQARSNEKDAVKNGGAITPFGELPVYMSYPSQPVEKGPYSGRGLEWHGYYPSTERRAERLAAWQAALTPTLVSPVHSLLSSSARVCEQLHRGLPQGQSYLMGPPREQVQEPHVRRREAQQ